jgi:hypothetical protein
MTKLRFHNAKIAPCQGTEAVIAIPLVEAFLGRVIACYTVDLSCIFDAQSLSENRVERQLMLSYRKAILHWCSCNCNQFT